MENLKKASYSSRPGKMFPTVLLLLMLGIFSEWFVWSIYQSTKTLIGYGMPMVIIGAFLIGLALVSLAGAFFGLPKVILSDDGVVVRGLFQSCYAYWDSIGKIQISEAKKVLRVEANVIGPDVDPAWKKNGQISFIIKFLRIAPADLLGEMEERQDRALRSRGA
jgi:hypothetical protein